MKPHRFDPFSFVVGLASVLFAAVLLWGNIDIADLRPSHLWPFPVLALGLLLSLYGVRRLWEVTRAPRPVEARTDQPESSSIQD